jgi:hypothetical protein
MPDLPKELLRVATESHSDIADTPAARAHQTAMTERQFGDGLLNRLREAKGELRLRAFQEEWRNTESGLVHEMSAEVEQLDPPE